MMESKMQTQISRMALTGLLALFSVAFATQSARAESKELVDYRLTEWKTKHFHDAEKADSIATSLKKLGCEVKQDSHDGHIDLSYRCPLWRRLTLGSHDEAHRWEKWLKDSGFETRHKH